MLRVATTVSRKFCSLGSALSSPLRRLLPALLLWAVGVHAAHANSCFAAASGGAGPADWASFCWLDFTGYNDATARSAGGQNFSFTLNDGSTLTLNLHATTTANPALVAVASPSWNGAAVGNSSFLGIAGSPVLYMGTSSATATVTLSSITVTPPGGVTATAGWGIVAVDAESTDHTETLSFTTNGGAWSLLSNVPPTTGAAYPTLSGTGTATVNEAGGGQTGSVGAYLFGSGSSPTTVSANMKGNGLEGVMFAVRYAWLAVNKTLAVPRLATADQFKYGVTATANGTQLVSSTSTGTGTGPFTAAQVTVAEGYPVTVSEAMATGSFSALTAYTPSLTCTNANTGSATALPSAAAVYSYNFGTLAYGDGISCAFSNTAKRPTLGVTKLSDVTSDPVDGTTNPKRIPGSVVRYIVTVTNTGTGSADASSIAVSDPVPANTTLCVSTVCSNPVVQFVNGTTSSGLTFNAATGTTYSNTAGGGAPFTYTPVPDAAGFDAAVTGVRIAPTGTMAGATAGGNPSFSVRFRVKVN